MGRTKCGLLFMVGLLADLTFRANGNPDSYFVSIQPSTLVVRFGDPVAVNCSVTDDHVGIGWEASEGSVPMTQDIQFVTWKLKTLTDWTIRPKCFVNFKASSPGPPLQRDKKLNITVYKPPDSVSIRAVNQEGPMMEGGQYQLQCEVQSIAPVRYLTVRWYKGTSELHHQTFNYDSSKTPGNVSPTLHITPTSADDGEQYRCEAELDLGPEGPQPPPSIKSEPLSITVHYRPLVAECPNHVELREGESLDTPVRCRAQGNPPPVVTWYRDQSEFKSSKPLTRRDDGQYTFIAGNIYGTAQHTLRVEVLYEPLISECPKHAQLHEGKSLSTVLSCRAEGKPSPVVTWYRGQSEFSSSTPLTARDSGQYTLTVTNALGTANHTLEIEVLYKPRITDCQRHVMLSEGESLDTVVVCRVKGNPFPKVMWYRDKSEHKSSTPLTRRDGGLYTFFVENTLGMANHTLEVEILYKPRILECPEHVTLKAGESLNTSVSCTADGNPLPAVTWYRDQSEFNSSTPLTRRDGGQYVFIAENSLGRITRPVNLTMLHPPNGRSVCLKPVRFTMFIIIFMVNLFCM